jgi:hypothetical protein
MWISGKKIRVWATKKNRRNEQPSHFNETDETGEIEFICEPI